MDNKDIDNRGRTPKPLIYYYVVVILTVLAFNMLIMPLFMSRGVYTVNYSDFINYVENENVVNVEFSDTEINFAVEKNGDTRSCPTQTRAL